jgi:hypothetical protein
MTALSFERIVHPHRSGAGAARRARTARPSLIGESFRAGRAFGIDSDASTAAQLRAVERFAARIDH